MVSPAGKLGLVPASMVAGQLYCEYRVHLDLGRSRAPTQGLARRVARRVIVEESERGLARVTVYGEVMGVPLVASPDFVFLTVGRRL
ncbi:hypothetical protein [Aeropyrum camini]|uniref:hypothetical protein n=1 Tax=Aeropyrum camini TaxID=229980 RepID=UPI0007872415|nr:hypothetical protein [Aeropyrum camini]